MAKKNIAPYIGVGGAINIKAIANQNNYGYNELDYSFAPGYFGGFMIGVDISNRHAYQIEFNFANAGQNYKDMISGNDNEKKVDLSYLQIPILYKRYMGKNAGVPNFEGKWESFYWLGGIQLGFLSSAEVEWQTNGQETDFLSFINQHGRNPHIQSITQMGAPEDDKEFFQSFDLGVVLGLGYHRFLAKNLFFTAELRGGLGVIDMNASEWRYENRDGIYQASRNAFGGIKLGLGVVLK